MDPRVSNDAETDSVVRFEIGIGLSRRDLTLVITLITLITLIIRYETTMIPPLDPDLPDLADTIATIIERFLSNRNTR